MDILIDTLSEFPEFDFEMEPEVDLDLEFLLQDNDEPFEQEVIEESQEQPHQQPQEQEQVQEEQVQEEHSQHQRIDNIGVQPKYIMTNVFRGDSIDTFYEKPLNKKMVSNEQVINVINDGTEDEILSLSNFVTGTPGTKAKCDTAMECKFFTDVTLCLVLKYNVTSVADVYRRVAMLSDRVCLGCKSTSVKVVCLSGKWRCHNCIKRGRDTDFIEGLEEWLVNGSPSRHTQTII
jgi:hypothetical protein